MQRKDLYAATMQVWMAKGCQNGIMDGKPLEIMEGKYFLFIHSICNACCSHFENISDSEHYTGGKKAQE